jgi:hypothetical protein
MVAVLCVVALLNMLTRVTPADVRR